MAALALSRKNMTGIIMSEVFTESLEEKFSFRGRCDNCSADRIKDRWKRQNEIVGDIFG